jgi:hypothetical protein
VEVDGQSPIHGSCPSKSDWVEAVGFAPGEVRTMLFYQQARKLGKVMAVKAEDQSAAALTVKLLPCATVTGRLLDSQGKPIARARLRADVMPSGDFSENLPPVMSDQEGRFCFDRVLPGADYAILASSPAIGFQTVAKKVSVEPGQTVDLGDVKLAPRG